LDDDPEARAFYLGWYDSYGEPTVFQEYVERGYNVMVPYIGRKEPSVALPFLAAGEAAGVSCYLQIPLRILDSHDLAGVRRFVEDALNEERTQRGSYRVDRAFSAWYLVDEPELNPRLDAEFLALASKIVRELDDRPVLVMNYEPEAMLRYGPFSDAVGIDYYPAVRMTLPFLYVSEGFYHRIKRAGVNARALGKDLTLALQGYGRSVDGKDQFFHRLPTARETAYMFWASLLERPRALLYWARYRTDPVWEDGVLQPVVRAFRELFPGRLGYRALSGYSAHASVGAIGLFDEQGASYALFVNNGFSARTVELVQPTFGRYDVILGDERGTDGRGRHSIPGHGILLVRMLGHSGSNDY